MSFEGIQNTAGYIFQWKDVDLKDNGKNKTDYHAVLE